MNAFAKVNRSRTMLIAALTCVMLAGSVSAFALDTRRGKAVGAVTIVTDGLIREFNSTSFVGLTTVSITVPANKVQLVEASFTADSSCQGPASQNWCSLTMVADGVEMSPATGLSYAFDGVGDGNDYFESHAMKRSILLGPGTHSVTVAAAVSLSGVKFFLDDWSFTITQYNNGK
jgi:hypothetical protein